MHRAFTLIELLVAVTIIALLLALLAPALDKAVYQAELATCGTRLHGIATGALTYAAGSGRRYPDRVNLWFAGRVNDGGFYDLRSICRDHIPLHLYLDPLSPRVDLSEQAAPPSRNVVSSYDLRFGWSFTGCKGMMRIGDRWWWENRASDVLASDNDRQARNVFVSASHPDDPEVMKPYVDPTGDTSSIVLSRWDNNTTHRRGALDMNFAFADGSVRRFSRVLINDPLDGSSVDDRFWRVPFYHDSANNDWGSDASPAEWQDVPAED